MHFIQNLISGHAVLVWHIIFGRRRSVSEIIEEGTNTLANIAAAVLDQNTSTQNMQKEPIEPNFYPTAYLAIRSVEELVSPSCWF